MMRLVILNSGGTIGVNGVFRENLDFSGCGIPNNFWAFQWNERGDNTGHIEYNSPMIQNDEVTEVPAWATACVAVWQATLDQEAAEAAAEKAAKAVQTTNEPTTSV